MKSSETEKIITHNKIEFLSRFKISDRWSRVVDPMMLIILLSERI